MFEVVLTTVTNNLIGFVDTSDALRAVRSSRNLSQSVTTRMLDDTAAQRPNEGWHLINYINYGGLLDVNFAYALLSRGNPHKDINCSQFLGFALAAALEQAGRLQHRPARRNAAVCVARMLLARGANAGSSYKVGILGKVWRPLLFIPMSHGDPDSVAMLLRARADATSRCSGGEPVLCQAFRNVLCAGDCSRDILNLLLDDARTSSFPDEVRELARTHLAKSVRFAQVSNMSDTGATEVGGTFWWAQGRGVRLCRRLYVDIERAAAGFPRDRWQAARHTRRGCRKSR